MRRQDGRDVVLLLGQLLLPLGELAGHDLAVGDEPPPAPLGLHGVCRHGVRPAAVDSPAAGVERLATAPRRPEVGGGGEDKELK